MAEEAQKITELSQRLELTKQKVHHLEQELFAKNGRVGILIRLERKVDRLADQLVDNQAKTTTQIGEFQFTRGKVAGAIGVLSGTAGVGGAVGGIVAKLIGS